MENKEKDYNNKHKDSNYKGFNFLKKLTNNEGGFPEFNAIVDVDA